MISCHLPMRQLPVVLPPQADELLSSWINRHAVFYGVAGGHLLRHCSLEAASLRELDLNLSSFDQRRLAHLFRHDPRAIRNMTQMRERPRPPGLIATTRPMQVCRRCVMHHRVEPATHGTRLRSWMEGWRINCPVCGTTMEDARPLDQLTRVDPDAPLLVAVTEPARQGELLMTRATREGRRGIALIDLMRCLLLPMASKLRGTLIANEIPRLLDIIVPGFDAFVHRWYPGFRRPGTLLLPLSVRIPVLAGVARVAREPNRWAESLLDAVAEIERPRLVACLGGLMAGRAWPHDPVQTGACVFR
jgi:hypothetical protein